MIVAFVDVITCTLYFFIGIDHPGLKYLNRYVRPNIGTDWYVIGLELLDVSRLEAIRKEYPNDSNSCATEMLKLWVERRVDASWNTLIQALRQPHIGLSVWASKIENMLVKEEDIPFKGMITIM